VSDSTFTRSLTAALLSVGLAPACAQAADGEGTALHLKDAAGKAAGDAAAGGGGTLVRTIVGLAIVLAVIWGISWVLRQVKASREGSASGPGLDTLATLPLGPNRALHLVRAGDEVHLVGAAEHGIVPVRSYTLEEARGLGLLGEEGADAAEPQGGLIPRPKRNWLSELRARTVIK
jgi:flagellar protein FliO/FliZ